MNAPIDISAVTLKTPRLILRPWRESDLEDLYAYARVDGVGQMTGWLPHQSIGESRIILNHFMEGRQTFCLEIGGHAVGSLGIERYPEKEAPEFAPLRCRELGFVLAREYWGRGLMPEAVRSAQDYLFGEVRLDALFCGHFPDNRQSARAQEKCGFRYYKTIETDRPIGRGLTVLTVMTREDWKRLPA